MYMRRVSGEFPAVEKVTILKPEGETNRPCWGTFPCADFTSSGYKLSKNGCCSVALNSSLEIASVMYSSVHAYIGSPRLSPKKTFCKIVTYLIKFVNLTVTLLLWNYLYWHCYIFYAVMPL